MSRLKSGTHPLQHLYCLKNKILLAAPPYLPELLNSTHLIFLSIAQQCLYLPSLLLNQNIFEKRSDVSTHLYCPWVQRKLCSSVKWQAKVYPGRLFMLAKVQRWTSTASRQTHGCVQQVVWQHQQWWETMSGQPWQKELCGFEQWLWAQELNRPTNHSKKPSTALSGSSKSSEPEHASCDAVSSTSALTGTLFHFPAVSSSNSELGNTQWLNFTQ